MQRSTAVAAMVLTLLIAGLTPGTPRASQNDSRLDALFAELRTTRDPQRGDRLGREIADIWLDSGNAVIDAHVARGRRLMRAGRVKDALETFMRVVKLAPDYAEGWDKRAHAHFLRGEFKEAIADIRRTLALEPRHFLALAGLGLIYLRNDDEEAAPGAFERALEINPHLAGARREATRLSRKLEKKDI